ncbi:MAG: type IV toxin-antitoxin system AbiEi family antitoxin domain-containing protein [Proteobacteria bacterium]|nr:type IV toxin-antitoxin system AbiEi family antitoxin domain-containing protein [Pseudomonadota bacterium]
MERTLSQNEAKVVLDLEWRNQKTVTLAELREALGASEGYARKLAHGLVKKGWLERLRPGLFQLVPADRGREGVADTNPLAAGAVLVPKLRLRVDDQAFLVRQWQLFVQLASVIDLLLGVVDVVADEHTRVDLRLVCGRVHHQRKHIWIGLATKH